MKFLILAALAAVALARPENFVSVTQDTAGNYDLLYDIGTIKRQETASADGNLHGSYSYLDGDGILRSISYTSGVGGFEVTGSHLPLQVVDEPAVALARSNHLLALQREGVVEVPVVAPVVAAPVIAGAPLPVQDTPEVIAARNEHFRLFEAARSGNLLLPIH